MCMYTEAILYIDAYTAFHRSSVAIEPSSTSPPPQLLLFVHPTLARSRSRDKKERGGRSAEDVRGGERREEGGMGRGEGLINGRRHAPESIAGREGRKSGETAGGKHGGWRREVGREDRTRNGGNADARKGRARESERARTSIDPRRKVRKTTMTARRGPENREKLKRRYKNRLRHSEKREKMV